MFYLEDTESERLRYRPLNRGDISLWTEYLKDPRNTQFYPDVGMTAEERAESWITSQLDRYEQGLHGMCAIHLKQSDEFVGQCGLLTQEVDGIEEIEVGYHLFAEHRGNGYATEAAQHMKEYGFKKGIADSIISIIDENNFPSQAVAKRNGMKEDKRTVWKDMNVIIFRTGS